MKWFWIILAIIYILSPYDLLPDFIPIHGWLDDAVIFFLLLRYFQKYRLKKSTETKYSSQQESNGGRSRPNEQQAYSSSTQPKDPYFILGLSTHAGPDEIKAAYKKLANRYHPDKVAHLGKEFQDLAEIKFKEIQQAYDVLRNR